MSDCKLPLQACGSGALCAVLGLFTFLCVRNCWDFLHKI